MHMLLSSLKINHTLFMNNYAQVVTHGITLITSNLVLSDSLVEFNTHCYYTYSLTELRFLRLCDDDNRFEDRLDLSKLDTGFFNLYLTSKAHITDNTIVRNLIAQKQAVAYVIGKS